MPKIFKTDIESEADLKVLECDVRSEAHLVFYETTSMWEATKVESLVKTSRPARLRYKFHHYVVIGSK